MNSDWVGCRTCILPAWRLAAWPNLVSVPLRRVCLAGQPNNRGAAKTISWKVAPRRFTPNFRGVLEVWLRHSVPCLPRRSLRLQFITIGARWSCRPVTCVALQIPPYLRKVPTASVQCTSVETCTCTKAVGPFVDRGGIAVKRAHRNVAKTL